MMEKLEKVLAKAKQVAVEYYHLTGKPLGITGEVGEYEAARLLKLKLAEARTPGYDAVDKKSGTRYEIKSLSTPEVKRPPGLLGIIRFKHDWDFALMVIMDRNLVTYEIWKASRDEVKKALAKPGSKARERGALPVSQFKRIGTRVWPKDA